MYHDDVHQPAPRTYPLGRAPLLGSKDMIMDFQYSITTNGERENNLSAHEHINYDMK